MNEGTIELASPQDVDAIWALYRSLLREPYGTWDEDYPSREIVEEDLANNDVLVLRLPEGGIGVAIVVEKSEEFEADVPWYPDVTRWCALGRLGVAHGLQGRGIAAHAHRSDGSGKGGGLRGRALSCRRAQRARAALVCHAGL